MRGAANDITSFDVKSFDNLVTVSGTTGNDVGAAAILVYSKDTGELVNIVSVPVSDDNTFTETLPLQYGKYADNFIITNLSKIKRVKLHSTSKSNILCK